MGQFQVPSELALPFAIVVGIAETFGAAMIIVPRFRRWGSILLGFLLIAFMAYIGAKYNILVQSGTAMLAQANQTPQSVLKLLQG